MADYIIKEIKIVEKVYKLVGLGGLEPPTSPLSGVRSNQAELQTHKNGNVHSTFEIELGQLIYRIFKRFIKREIYITKRECK